MQLCVKDLLRHRNNVTLCEDSNNNNMKLLNVAELPTDSSKNLVELLERVKSLRTTKSTSVNSQSSRSHLVCYINLRRNDVDRSLYGQLVLLDLAGRQVIYSAKDYLLDVTHSHYESCSERNEDSFYHDTIRHRETIEINKSHLALKQCIRAIGSEDTTGYVPYRSSTLTRILKDCLWAHDSRASVIATISPISIGKV
jgi:kinesin family protein 2/24